jgi:hypothetical protein
MPNWIVPLLVFIALVGFIGFAFRQGMRVKPDKDNPDNWPNSGGDTSPGDGSHGGYS